MRTRIKATPQKNQMMDTKVVVEVLLTNVSTGLNLAGIELNEYFFTLHISLSNSLKIVLYTFLECRLLLSRKQFQVKGPS